MRFFFSLLLYIFFIQQPLPLGALPVEWQKSLGRELMMIFTANSLCWISTSRIKPQRICRFLYWCLLSSFLNPDVLILFIWCIPVGRVTWVAEQHVHHTLFNFTVCWHCACLFCEWIRGNSWYARKSKWVDGNRQNTSGFVVIFFQPIRQLHWINELISGEFTFVQTNGCWLRRDNEVFMVRCHKSVKLVVVNFLYRRLN